MSKVEKIIKDAEKEVNEIQIITNESLSISKLRSIVLIQSEFFGMHKQYANKEQLIEKWPYLFNKLYFSEKGVSGYIYNFACNEGQIGFWCRASPLKYGVTGYRYFWLDDTMVIREGLTKDVNKDSPILQK